MIFQAITKDSMVSRYLASGEPGVVQVPVRLIVNLPQEAISPLLPDEFELAGWTQPVNLKSGWHPFPCSAPCPGHRPQPRS